MNTKRAFTLVETLVAITILMIAVAGPLTIANKALRSALYARNQVVANYLAQDAMEMVKNIRDNVFLTSGGATWPPSGSHPLSGCINGTCTIDTITSVATISTGSGNLCLQSTTGKFTHSCTSPNTPTLFTRTFQLITVPTNPNEYTVIVTVTWPEGVTAFSEILKGSIYNAIR